MNITKKNLRLVLRITIIVMVIAGVIGQYFSGILVDKGWTSLLFYTTQSNLLVAATYLFLLIYELKDKKTPRLILIFEHIAVSATTLTFIVFALFLGPYIANVRYFYSLQNLTLHNLVPIFSIITYLIGKDTGQKRIIPFALISGFSYLIFAYLLYFLKIPFGSFEFPYFFMDFNQYGWLRIQGINFGVIYWWITIALYYMESVFYSSNSKKKQSIQKKPHYMFSLFY